jgi:hypothetical protein
VFFGVVDGKKESKPARHLHQDPDPQAQSYTNIRTDIRRLWKKVPFVLNA